MNQDAQRTQPVPRNVARRIWSGIHVAQSSLLLVLMGGVTLLVTIQVILRYVLRAPLMGIEEMELFPVAWLYFLGNAQASFERTQIEAGVIEVWIKNEALIHLGRILASTITVGIATWLAYWAYRDLIFTIQSNKHSALLYWPLSIAQSATFVGFLLMAAYSVVELTDYILKLLHLRLRTLV